MLADRQLALALLCGAIATLSAGRTHAYCRTTTIGTPASSGGGCLTQGLPVYHPSRCVPYHLLQKESARIPNPALSNALATAFATWSAPSSSCTPGITAVELAPVGDAAVVGYTRGVVGNNVIGVVEPWSHGDANDTLALTTLTFDTDTGAIVDVDMEIRGDVPWAVTGAPSPDQYDLAGALNHEAGHFYGLAHSEDSSSVMHPAAALGSTSGRRLTTDDERAICAVYPSRVARSSSTGLVAATECQLAATTSGTTCDPQIAHGCTMGAHTSDPRTTSGALSVCMAAAIFSVVRRRRWKRPA